MIKAFTSRRRLALTVLVVAVTATAGLGVAYAAIPDFNGTIHGCYKSDKGDLRVIDPAATTKEFKACKNDETPLDWSQTGPQGPEGPQGPQGPQGPEGSGHAYVANGGLVTIDGSTEIVALTGLPAGNYLVWAPVIVVGDGDGGTNHTCLWKINDTTNVIPQGYTFMYDAKDDGFGKADMSASVTLPTANSSIKVRCGANTDGAEAHGQIMALKVGAIN